MGGGAGKDMDATEETGGAGAGGSSAGRDAATMNDSTPGDASGDANGATGGAGSDAADSGTKPDCPGPHGGRDVIGNIRVPRDYSTIQAAIEGAADGSTVSVAAGTYFENIDFKGKAIRLASESGPELTIIDGSSSGTVVYFQTHEGLGSVLQGFTIRHGSAPFGAGVSLRSASPTIIGNVFDSNQQGGGGFGAAIGGNNASPVIDSNLFRHNSCDTQFVSGVVSFVNNSSPRIVNNAFIDNPCRGINLGLPVGNAPEVSNNTFVGNDTGIYVDSRVSTEMLSFRNNIIVGGSVGYEIVFGDNNPHPVWTHNLVFGNTTNFKGVTDPTGTDGNLAVDPKLTTSPDRYHLTVGSPGIDVGTNSGQPLPNLDVDGRKRILDGNHDGVSVVDLGATEFVANDGCGR